MPALPLLVGRDREREQAGQVLVPASPSPFVLLEGEAGIGKTRLVREIVEQARQEGSIVVAGATEPGDGASLPFSLWRGPLHQLGGRVPPADPGASLEERRWETWEHLDRLLPPTGVLIVVEDLHWADDDSLWILRRIVGAFATVPVLATSRPAPTTASRLLDLRREATIVALQPLTATDIGRLMDDAQRDAEEAERVLHRTGGNPLLVHEVLAGERDGTGSAVLANQLRDLFDEVGPDATSTVQMLALAGAATPVGVIAAARGVAPNQVVAEIARAVQADILRSGTAQVSFRHDLLAETTVHLLEHPARVDLHRRLAHAWSAQGSDVTARRACANHLLAAAPDGDVDAALELALAVGAELSAAGRWSEAAELCSRAATRADTLVPGALDVRARLHLAASEAQWMVGDIERATESGQRAAALADEGGTVDTRAAAAVAALGHHNPFLPDPVTVARLDRLIDELVAHHGGTLEEPRAAPLLVRLLGRRAILGVSIADQFEESRHKGDTAVALARALGDPELVVAALRDRYFAPVTLDDLDELGAVVTEILELARSSGRPELALLGHEWSIAEHLGRGDLAGAEAALDRYAVLGRLMSSPLWRYSEMVRRVNVLTMRGRFDDALALAAEARSVGTEIVPEPEHLGLHLGAVVTIGLVSGMEVPGVGEMQDQLMALSGQWPVPFVQIRAALGCVYRGRAEEARRRVEPWLDDPGALLFGPEGLNTLAVLAEVQWRSGDARGASKLRHSLAPYAGRFPLSNASGAPLPSDVHLGWLSLLDDDPAAIDHASAAITIGRSMPSAPVEAHGLALLAAAQRAAGDPVAAKSAHDAAESIGERLGMVLPNPPGVGRRAPGQDASGPGAPKAARGRTTRTARLERHDDTWSIESPYGSASVPDSVGLGQLARLLSRPGSEVRAGDLAGAGAADAPPPAADVGPALDPRAKREYRRRITELQADIDEAEDHHDLERASRARAELDLLMQQLRQAVGLGGRDRPQQSGNERARVNTTRNLRRAIRAIEAELPELGAHLTVSVRTGHHCSYAPEPAAALDWTVVVSRAAGRPRPPREQRSVAQGTPDRHDTRTSTNRP